MGKYRTLTEKNKYYIPKEDYLTAIHYSLRYPLWLAELQDIRDTSSAIQYDKDRVQTSVSDDMVVNAALRASEISMKVDLIDNTIHQCAEGMDKHLRLGVCYGLTFAQLKNRGMPCERDMYYRIRQRYYYELSRKI
jgi:hypothetical protein